MADAADSKSADREVMGVRPSPRAPSGNFLNFAGTSSLLQAAKAFKLYIRIQHQGGP